MTAGKISNPDRPTPDEDAMVSAMDAFLRASQIRNLESSVSVDIKAASRKFSKIWIDRFLVGYEMSASLILGNMFTEGRLDSPQYVTGLTFSGLCPHDLLPFHGTASVAYIPDKGTVGFGQIADLVQCFTSRLTLQETACNQIMRALTSYVSSTGSACVLRANHQCFAVSKPAQASHVITTVAASGCFQGDHGLLDHI